MDTERSPKPYLIGVPRYFGVRCACGATLVIDEIRGDPETARCDRLDHPAWITCDACGAERQFTRADVVKFAWPPHGQEPWY